MKILGTVTENDGRIIEVDRQEFDALKELVDAFGENREWLDPGRLMPPDHPIDHWIMAVRLFAYSVKHVKDMRTTLDGMLVRMEHPEAADGRGE